MTSKKKSNKNSKKRDVPDGASWDETALTDLLAQDVRQLLLNRGVKKQNLQRKKSDLIEYLKEKYDVELKEDFDDLTVKELMVELRLRKLDDSLAKKDVLIQRLRGEIEAPASEEKKKRKRGRGAVKSATQKIYVVLYVPPVGTEKDPGTQVLGVFKQKKKAYEKGLSQMMEDLEQRYKGSKKKFETATTEIEKVKEDNVENKLETVSECVIKAYGQDEAPYVEITETSLS